MVVDTPAFQLKLTPSSGENFFSYCTCDTSRSVCTALCCQLSRALPVKLLSSETELAYFSSSGSFSQPSQRADQFTMGRDFISTPSGPKYCQTVRSELPDCPAATVRCQP